VSQRRHNALLDGPAVPTLVGLAWPVFVVLALQAAVGVAETYFVSALGTDAVAGVTLVLPIVMLMVTMSNGGIGGGVASAVARALGARRGEEAGALAVHAIMIGVAFGAAFSALIWLGGPTIFRLLGGRDAALENAMIYANLVFAAAIPSWIANLLAAALRGAGNVRVPALVSAGTSLVGLLVSPALIFGWGVVPALGVAGAGLSVAGINAATALILMAHMASRNASLRLRPCRLEARHFVDILRVGLPSAFGTIVASITVVLATGYVGRYGAESIAGYGLASRIDHLLIPLFFALGSATLTMVGTSVGAQRPDRARQAAWAGVSISAVLALAIGGLAAVLPGQWMRLFSDEPAVIAVGTAYLVRVGPMYVFFGVGMAMYFASQGMGRMTWPLAAGLARVAVVGLGGLAWTVAWGGGLEGVFWIVAAGYLAFGGISLFALIGRRGWAAGDEAPAARSAVERAQSRAGS
jgi:putative MATE family efflux protein